MNFPDSHRPGVVIAVGWVLRESGKFHATVAPRGIIIGVLSPFANKRSLICMSPPRTTLRESGLRNEGQRGAFRQIHTTSPEPRSPPSHLTSVSSGSLARERGWFNLSSTKPAERLGSYVKSFFARFPHPHSLTDPAQHNPVIHIQRRIPGTSFAFAAVALPFSLLAVATPVKSGAATTWGTA